MSLALSMTRMKTGVFTITVTQADGSTAQDLTGSTLYFHAATEDGAFDLTKSSPSSGITITSASLGLASLQIDPADTESLSATGSYSIPCELTMVSGSNRYEVASGALVVTPNVGTP